ncbi:MAG: MoxR family ATPase [Deltaproteobacteria bacterium]|nr:MoxR family ATPase [Deltaproteobacteria bacterium]
MRDSAAASLLGALRAALGRVIHGKADVLERVLVGLLGGGHVLLEDVPGVGKTTLARTLAKVFTMECTRVQFTPDLLPTDILGAQVLNPRDGSFSFHKGPVFTQVLLADEINRASPRTQSALLEAMNEDQVTIDGVSHPLPRPFFVLATQNPVDYQGTYPLPEAQLDRFLLRVGVGYPPPDAELAMLYARQRSNPLDAIEAITGAEELLAMQATVREVELKEPVGRYLLAIITATRKAEALSLGVSPRGALALFRATQARAYLQGRAYATPDDVQALAVPVLAHRVQLTAQARYGGTASEAIIAELLRKISVPT